MPTETASETPAVAATERADLAAALTTQRRFLRQTVQGLTDQQATLRPTASELCLGGIVKHVALVESGWVDFIVDGPASMGRMDEAAYEAHSSGFRMEAEETLAGVLAGYDRVARRSDELLASMPSLDRSHPLPEAPWFESGASWSARRVFLHLVAETAQHAGHADIIRESIDGAKTMG
jgi:hypothetical protein